MNKIEALDKIIDALRYNKVDIQTDNNGQIIIYTGLAVNIEGEIVEFDSNAPVGAYVGSEDEQEDYPGNDDDLFEKSRAEHELERIIMRVLPKETDCQSCGISVVGEPFTLRQGKPVCVDCI
jgi:hypothetical protein